MERRMERRRVVIQGETRTLSVFCKLRTSSSRETRAVEKHPGASTLNEALSPPFLSLFFFLADSVDSCDARVDCTHARAWFFFFRANRVLPFRSFPFISFSSFFPVSRDSLLLPASFSVGAALAPTQRERTSGAFEQIENTRRIRLITET